MEKQSGWTTLEQSKKLVEAGLDPETADMYYGKYDTINANTLYDSCDIEYFNIHEYTPCWSLGRLIELMPKYIETKNMYGKEEKCGLQILPYNSNMVTYIDEVGGRFTYIKGENIFNNVFEMVIWLLEGGYIKKGETK